MTETETEGVFGEVGRRSGRWQWRLSMVSCSSGWVARLLVWFADNGDAAGGEEDNRCENWCGAAGGLVARWRKNNNWWWRRRREPRERMRERDTWLLRKGNIFKEYWGIV